MTKIHSLRLRNGQDKSSPKHGNRKRIYRSPWRLKGGSNQRELRQKPAGDGPLLPAKYRSDLHRYEEQHQQEEPPCKPNQHLQEEEKSRNFATIFFGTATQALTSAARAQCSTPPGARSTAYYFDSFKDERRHLRVARPDCMDLCSFATIHVVPTPAEPLAPPPAEGQIQSKKQTKRP